MREMVGGLRCDPEVRYLSTVVDVILRSRRQKAHCVVGLGRVDTDLNVA